MNKRITTDVLYEVFGSIFYGISLHCFLTPAGIAPGGVSGISIMLNFLFGLPIGQTAIIINIPILIIGFIYLDRRIIFKSLRAILITSIMLDNIITPIVPKYFGDKLLGSVFGGIFLGLGLGIIFLRGSTTGGTDIISLLIKRKKPHLKIGFLMLLVDVVIISASMLVFREIEAALYGIISLYCSIKIIDYIVYGMDKGVLTLIVSDENEKIANDILTKLKRGVTYLNAEGGYKRKNTTVLMCITRTPEFPMLKEIINDNDQNAFYTTSSVENVYGEGFIN